ncbi:MAG: cyclic nucleotide-binding domain-containing protein [Endomicrobiia bacterium]
MNFLSEQEILWIKNLLKKIDFLSDVSDEEITCLANSIEKKQYKPGQSIIFQGEISNRLYIINKGRVSVNVVIRGEKKKIAELSSGEYFGEISLIEPTGATATLKAEEPCLIYAITSDEFKKIAEKRPSIIETLKRKIVQRRESLIR